FLVLGKADGSTSQVNLGAIGAINNDMVNPAAGNAVGIFGSYQTRNLPGSGSHFTWNAQAQEALYKSMQQGVGGGSSVTSLYLNLNYSLLKNSHGDDVVQITGQPGVYGELDTPNLTTKNWVFRAGAGAF